MSSDIRHIDARQLKAQLHDGGEIAVLDAREEGVFALRHLLLASCVPLSRLELLVDDLVRYFPAELRKKEWRPRMDRHRLKREIIATA